MKLSFILCAIGVLIVVHLSFLVIAEESNRQRNLSNDIRNGISLAGKLLGVDSPSNIATISNIAELVTRAFSNNAPSSIQNNNQGTPSNWHDRSSMEKYHPSGGLETLDETQNTQENDIDDGVIVGTNINTGSDTMGGGDNGFLGRILRVLGMDTSKIGALAVNGIIFIAQMIGQSFMSTLGRFGNNKGNQNQGSDTMSNYHEQMYRNDPSSTSSILENAFEWIYDQSKKNPALSNYMNAMLDKNLPENIVKMINENYENSGNMNAANIDCENLLVCKSAPIIWGMQEAVSKQLNDDTDNANNERMDSSNPTDAFFKYLPDVKVFQNHGDGCEQRYAACNIF